MSFGGDAILWVGKSAMIDSWWGKVQGESAFLFGHAVCERHAACGRVEKK